MCASLFRGRSVEGKGEDEGKASVMKKGVGLSFTRQHPMWWAEWE